ncbi:fluoride efflux transporter FluC [Halovenus rubra]|uniref:Fluoride-specific ion channel FluC n=2 Tax=Halovenus rubra TaxID=869890 RepID=A0ABD5X3R3_9EURY|nr:CrcB family protein [Halovenus rubra]
MSSSRSSAFALIAVGGFVGAGGRYALAVWLPETFPWGTLAANVFGTFLLGVVLYDQHLADRLSAETRLLVGTGFCSSFTTYSTFAAETVSLSPALAAANVVANYVLGFAAILLGRAAVRWSR